MDEGGKKATKITCTFPNFDFPALVSVSNDDLTPGGIPYHRAMNVDRKYSFENERCFFPPTPPSMSKKNQELENDILRNRYLCFLMTS